MASVIRSTRLLASRGVRMLQTRNYAEEGLKLTLVSANKIFYDSVVVKQVDVPSYSGDFGILATHVPTLGMALANMNSFSIKNIFICCCLCIIAAVLKPGIVTVYETDGASKKVFVSSGTVTVNKDSSVQVLAEEAHPIEDIDLRAAQEALSASQSELAAAKDDRARAEATLAVEIAQEIVNAAK